VTPSLFGDAVVQPDHLRLATVSFEPRVAEDFISVLVNKKMHPGELTNGVNEREGWWIERGKPRRPYEAELLLIEEPLRHGSRNWNQAKAGSV